MTKELNRRSQGISTYGQQLFMTVGIVKNNADPAHHGRVQAFCPSIDSEDFQVENLPWAWYVSPFGGVTANAKVGRELDTVEGITGYGMWAIPKNGAQVLIGFLDGNPENRFYIGCFFMPEHNRTLPAGIDDDGMKTEIDESGYYGQHEIPALRDNQAEAGLYKDDTHYRTRGAYERSVSHPSNKNKVKPTDNGYAPKPLEPEKADSQIYSWTTPGRHYMTMSDVDEYCRVRLKTTAGNQVIFDDTNERIYISTARGRNWIELDEGSGKINIYSTSKLNFHAENDINFYSNQNINMVARKRVNIVSEQRAVKLQAALNVEALSQGGNIKLTAARDMHLKTTNGPRYDAAEEQSECRLPPYDGGPMGLVRDFADEGGSGSSRIIINGVDGLELRSDKGRARLTARNGIDIKSMDAGLKLQGSSGIDVRAGTGLKLTARTNVDIKGESGNIALDGKRVSRTGTILTDSRPVQQQAVGAAGADSAEAADAANGVEGEEIPPKMVIPMHESWDRDEDEGDCPTPRNSKYQG